MFKNVKPQTPPHGHRKGSFMAWSLELGHWRTATRTCPRMSRMSTHVTHVHACHACHARHVRLSYACTDVLKTSSVLKSGPRPTRRHGQSATGRGAHGDGGHGHEESGAAQNLLKDLERPSRRRLPVRLSAGCGLPPRGAGGGAARCRRDQRRGHARSARRPPGTQGERSPPPPLPPRSPRRRRHRR